MGNYLFDALCSECHIEFQSNDLTEDEYAFTNFNVDLFNNLL